MPNIGVSIRFGLTLRNVFLLHKSLDAYNRLILPLMLLFSFIGALLAFRCEYSVATSIITSCLDLITVNISHSSLLQSGSKLLHIVEKMAAVILL